MVAGVSPFLDLGLSAGFTVSGKIESYPVLVRVRGVGPSMHPIDYGWAAGTGVEFAAGSGRIGVEARFTRGFGDLFDIQDNLSLINQAVTLSVSYAR